MYIVLDSNIYFNNPLLKRGLLKNIINVVNNKGYILLLPNVIIDEVNSNFRKSSDQAFSELKSAINKINTYVLCEHEEDYEYTEKSAKLNDFDFEKIMKNKVGKHNLIILPYPNITHENIIKRIYSRKAPFTKSDTKKEVGYKDYLIWNSILEFLASQSDEKDIVFITDNKNDFCSQYGKNELDTDGHIKLHSDMLNDISELEINNEFKIYRGVGDFSKELRKDVNYKPHDGQPLIDYKKAMDIHLGSYLSEYLDDNLDVLLSVDEYMPLRGMTINFVECEGLSLEIIDCDSDSDSDSVKYKLTCKINRLVVYFNANKQSSISNKFIGLNIEFVDGDEIYYYLTGQCTLDISLELSVDGQMFTDDYPNIIIKNISNIRSISFI